MDTPFMFHYGPLIMGVCCVGGIAVAAVLVVCSYMATVKAPSK